MERGIMESAIRSKRAATIADDSRLILRLWPAVELTDDQFFALAQLNREVRMERTATGELILMPPTGGETSDRNAGITAQLWWWAKQDGRGRTFDSSGGFVLPNGAVRSPDAAWVEREHLAALTDEQRRKFLPLCPDFAIELRSSTDRLGDVQEKMREYLDNGARLAWLIDPHDRRVYVYRPQAPVQQLDGPDTVSGDPLLRGFVLDLREVWSVPT